MSSKDVGPNIRSIELCDLEPRTEYEVELSVVTVNKTYRSPKIGFISPSDDHITTRTRPEKSDVYEKYLNVYNCSDLPQPIAAFGGRRAYRGGVGVGYVSSKGPIVYRLDEIAIVVFVLCFWMAVIFLFCNKWGKIRHLEPYQPQYQPETPFQSPVYSIHGKPQRMNTCNSNSYPPFFTSRVNIQSFERQRTFSQGSKIGSLCHYASAYIYPPSLGNRQRVNSVFVGMSSPVHNVDVEASPLKRKYKSAEDIKMYSFKNKFYDNQKRASQTNLSHFHPYFRQ
ncbi:Phosphorylated CTD-interacting factor-like protein [Leptotrombidium deliense]|uniref:Phosphorylated CTD-interacting factor-like protein n=1 Tax=Leptotrombidium deliense TaxID=299467 RepID=A0A443SSA8_9ACAR|nr:Phosphorylated CTD-interacting factor-like protein [Leptotrombidium deliense]